MKTRMVNYLSIFVVLLLPQVNLSLSVGDVSFWCNQTPYPQQCKYHMSYDIPFVSKKQFLTMAQQTALMEVSSSLRFADSLVSRVQHDGTERSVWRTCLFFYSQAAFRLNRSLDSSLGSTADDVQTWLSAAASNIRACHGGFFDVNVTSDIFPLVMLNNVTELISNCLAVNFGFMQQEEGIRHEGVIKVLFDIAVVDSNTRFFFSKACEKLLNKFKSSFYRFHYQTSPKTLIFYIITQNKRMSKKLPNSYLISATALFFYPHFSDNTIIFNSTPRQTRF